MQRLPRGSMPAVVNEGITGFLVVDLDEAGTALARKAVRDGRAVRAVVVRRFFAERMVEDYIGFCQRLLDP